MNKRSALLVSSELSKIAFIWFEFDTHEQKQVGEIAKMHSQEQLQRNYQP
jgi:hypothetical protein